MIKHLLNKLCNIFGYTIIPVVLPYTMDKKCTKDRHCECEVCLPW